MEILSGFVCAAVLATAIPAPVAVHAQATDNWKPVWTAMNELHQPAGYRQRIYLGSPIMPEGLNDHKAVFPESHNVYIPPQVLDAFKKTGEYPESSIFVKELQLTVSSTEFPDGPRTEVSGRGYFPGVFNGMDVMVKDSKPRNGGPF